MTYRRDIDGLRALAIIPVVLMHAGVPYFDGGYVGVDVFFVISGYLITSLLLRDLRENRFSIIEFYERRFRRIFPALAAVLAFSIIACHFLLFPSDYRAFSQSVVATLFFASNILFNDKLGYFSLSAERTPLLHTWSLGVEEQFYIVLPLALFLITRYFRKRYVLWLGLLVLASFAFSIWQVQHNPQAAFYLLPARTWELLTGAMLATRFLPGVKQRIAEPLGLAGLALIGWSIFRFNADTPFPGPNALFPCLGAALIIYSGEASKTIVTRLLSIWPMAFTGSISYSLYLWHWVLIVLGRYYVARPFTPLEVIAAVVGSFATAWLSWRFVESPFRKRQGGLSRRGVFITVGATSAMLGIVAGMVFLADGLPNRFPAEANAAVTPYRPPLDCGKLVCSVGTPGGPETFLVWGDSHALALGGVLDTVAREKGLSGILVGRITCPPLMNVRRFDRPAGYCNTIGSEVLQLVRTKKIRNVVLHARWAIHSEDMRFGQETGAGSGLPVHPPPEDNYPVFQNMLRETLSQLKALNTDIYLMASVPEAGIDVPFVFARSLTSGIARDFTVPLEDFKKRQARTFLALEREGDVVSGNTLYPHEFLCSTTACLLADGNQPLYGDYHHLNQYGMKKLKPFVEELLSRPQFASD
jgi:peptidoglycan/LPS O-acetylase OafA/YrhL